MENEKEIKKTRRPYRKPQLEQVQLVAEEAVLAGCKTAGMGGPDGTGCVHTPAGRCSAPKS